VHHGYVHIHASSTHAHPITDTEGNVIAWSSAGGIGFKGAQRARRSRRPRLHHAGNTAKTYGLRSVEGEGKGAGRAVSRRFAPADGRHRGEVDRDVHADSAQRRPPDEAETRVVRIRG